MRSAAARGHVRQVRGSPEARIHRIWLACYYLEKSPNALETRLQTARRVYAGNAKLAIILLAHPSADLESPSRGAAISTLDYLETQDERPWIWQIGEPSIDKDRSL